MLVPVLLDVSVVLPLVVMLVPGALVNSKVLVRELLVSVLLLVSVVLLIVALWVVVEVVGVVVVVSRLPVPVLLV